MNNRKMYNVFLFLFTFTRSLIEVFSVVVLYNKGYTVNNIFLFLFVVYLVSIFVIYISLVFNYKLVLIISVLLYGVEYLYMAVMESNIVNLIFLGIVFAISNSSYHVVRHYLALVINRGVDKVSNNSILFIIYGSAIVSNIIGMFLINKTSIYYLSIILILLSVISIVPVFLFNFSISKKEIIFKKCGVEKRKFFFSIFSQFKVILLELQPLFLYLYISSNFKYVGLFNLIVNFASLITMLFISNKINKMFFKYINFLLCFVLLLKFSFFSEYLLFIFAFFEGIGMKLYEKFSLDNLYDYNGSSIKGYLLFVEIVFFLSKALFMLFFLVLNLNIRFILYICVLFIFISSFFL